VVGDRFFKGSGTSQAAAVVSGAAALLLQRRPALTPDEVKALLKGTATPLLGQPSSAQGAGLVDVVAASAAPTPLLRQSWPTSTGKGTLQGARGSQRLYDGKAELTGEKDIFGVGWKAGTWAAKSSSRTAWGAGSWNGSAWAGSGWTGTSWASLTWPVVGWPRTSWGGASWSSRSWSDESWSSRSWSGTGWTSRSWSSRSWSGAYWA
jgi:serine protease AprX